MRVSRKAKGGTVLLLMKGIRLSLCNRSAREVRWDLRHHNDPRVLHRREAYEIRCIHFDPYWKHPRSDPSVATCRPFSYRNSLLAPTSSERAQFGGWLAQNHPRLGICACSSNCAGKPPYEKKQLACFSQSVLCRNPNTLGKEKPLVCLAKLCSACRGRNLFR